MDAPDLQPSPRLAAGSSTSLTMLCAVFALSGAAALIFETLFFRLAGLALGNSVQAAAIVLFSFMTGLGIGNAVASRLVQRVGRPLLLFALLEAVVAVTGAGLILVFPSLSQALVPLFRPLLDSGAALHLSRLAVAVALFVTPAIAMGMTLPVLVGALSSHDSNLGSALGRLYGWNTAGAVAGALLAERVLVSHLGVSRAGVAAAGLDVAAVGCVLWLRRGRLVDRLPPRARPASREAPTGVDPAQLAILAAAFLCGANLLALEVVWFRFFLLFTPALSWNLALMLAVVLAGIASGGLAAGRLCRWQPRAMQVAPVAVAASGAAVALLYSGLVALWPRLPGVSPIDVYVYLMFPVSFLSGAIFTLLGSSLEGRGLPPTVATGRLAGSNTAGGAIGSVIGGFALIPLVGIETSFRWIALSYGFAAVLAAVGLASIGALRGRRLVLTAAVYALALASFPSGALPGLLSLPGSVRTHLEERGYELVAFREAVTETLQYFRKSVFGETLHTILVTNDHPMAGTMVSNRRYMKAYVYWSIAMNPASRNALLISYGVGGTARALADTPGLETIDIVDTSSAVLEMSRIIYPQPGELPLDDPRVRVHVEDGRFFLATTERRFDLITGEPPPPRHAGVGNLYSQEYFELVRSRLRPGGVVTYWLSVHQLRVDETRSVLRGFCNVFLHCSLWSGNGLEWMMVAIVDPGRPAAAEGFERQWRDPALRQELTTLGFSDPDTLGAVFIADGERLRSWIGDAPPLVDEFPQRIASRPVRPSADELRAYHSLMGDPAAQDNFFRSEVLAAYWPSAWRTPTPEHRRRSRLMLADLWLGRPYETLWATLSRPELEEYMPWVLGSEADAARIAARALASDPDLPERDLPEDAYAHLTAAALAARDLPLAGRALARWQERGGSTARPALDPLGLTHLRVTLLLAGGSSEQAVALMRRRPVGPAALERSRRFWSFARETFDPQLRFDELTREAP